MVSGTTQYRDSGNSEPQAKFLAGDKFVLDLIHFNPNFHSLITPSACMKAGGRRKSALPNQVDLTVRPKSTLG